MTPTSLKTNLKASTLEGCRCGTEVLPTAFHPPVPPQHRPPFGQVTDNFSAVQGTGSSYQSDAPLPCANVMIEKAVEELFSLSHGTQVVKCVAQEVLTHSDQILLTTENWKQQRNDLRLLRTSARPHE